MKHCKESCTASDCLCTIHKDTERISICICPACQAVEQKEHNRLVAEYSALKKKLDKALSLLGDMDLAKVE